MGKNITKKKSLVIKGVLNTDENEILVEVADVDEPVKLKEYLKDFNCQDVTISVSLIENLA